MKIVKLKRTKTAKAKDVYGGKFSNSELEFQKKHNIYNPENDNMLVSSEGPKTIAQFGRELKELNPNLYIVFNANTPRPEAPMGHAIRFRTQGEEHEYDPICGVGIANNKIIPAMSQMEHYYDKEINRYESRFTCMGWIPALEMVVNYLSKKNLLRVQR